MPYGYAFIEKPILGSMALERRKHDRWDGHILVDLEDPSGLIFESVGMNLSIGGMCLVFPDAPAPHVGAQYKITFRLSNLDAPIENTIEVRWVDAVRTKICGVAFLDGLRAIEVYALNELISLAQ